MYKMAEKEKFCPECGTINDVDSNFCRKCGSDLPKAGKQGLEDKSALEIAREQGHAESDTKAFDQSSYGAQEQEPYGFDQSSYGSQQQPPGDFSGEIVESNNAIEGFVNILTKPKQSTPALLLDPDAPSSTPLMLIAALFAAVLSYFVITDDSYFNYFYKEQLEEQLSDTGMTIDQLRDTYSIMMPILSALLVILVWYVGAWLLGMFVKGGAYPNSPLKYNASGAMRQLYGYRMVPHIFILVIQLIIVLSYPPDTYNELSPILIIIPVVISAIILYRALGPHLGYNGSAHKIFAFLAAFAGIVGISFVHPI